MTAFYMFRLWFLTFTGKPRDAHVYEHAHESPVVMTRAADRPGGLQRRRRVGLADLGRRRELPRARRCAKAEPAAVAIGFERGDARRPTSTTCYAGGLALVARRSAGAGSPYRVLRPQAASLATRSTRPVRRRVPLPPATSGTSTRCTTRLFVEPDGGAGAGPAAADKRPTDAPPPPATPNCRRSGSICSRSTAS